MRILILAAMLFSLPAVAQDGVTRIFISARSNVSAAELGREFDSHCPSVRISESQQRADFDLEAIDNGSGVARKPYKFALFNSDGDRVYSTETGQLTGAVKDICKYIQNNKSTK
jgi:hypothetical protein